MMVRVGPLLSHCLWNASAENPSLHESINLAISFSFAFLSLSPSCFACDIGYLHGSLVNQFESSLWQPLFDSFCKLVIANKRATPYVKA